MKKKTYQFLVVTLSLMMMLAASCGRESFLLDDVSQLPLERLKQAASVGLSSGASSPEFIFDACLKKLQELGFGCEEKNEI